MQLRKEAMLNFLGDPEVPVTNNSAERDLRMMKLRMKIPGSSGECQIFCVNG